MGICKDDWLVGVRQDLCIAKGIALFVNVKIDDIYTLVLSSMLLLRLLIWYYVLILLFVLLPHRLISHHAFLHPHLSLVFPNSVISF